MSSFIGYNNNNTSSDDDEGEIAEDEGVRGGAAVAAAATTTTNNNNNSTAASSAAAAQAIPVSSETNPVHVVGTSNNHTTSTSNTSNNIDTTVTSRRIGTPTNNTTGTTTTTNAIVAPNTTAVATDVNSTRTKSPFTTTAAASGGGGGAAAATTHFNSYSALVASSTTLRPITTATTTTAAAVGIQGGNNSNNSINNSSYGSPTKPIKTSKYDDEFHNNRNSSTYPYTATATISSTTTAAVQPATTTSTTGTTSTSGIPPPPPPLPPYANHNNNNNYNYDNNHSTVRGGGNTPNSSGSYQPQLQPQSYSSSSSSSLTNSLLPPRGNGGFSSGNTVAVSSTTDDDIGGFTSGGWPPPPPPPLGGGTATAKGGIASNSIPSQQQQQHSMSSTAPHRGSATYDNQQGGGGDGGSTSTGWQPRVGGSGGGRGMYRGGGGGGGGRGGGTGGNMQRHHSYGGGGHPISTATSSSSLLGAIPPKNAINMRSQSYGPTSMNAIPSHRDTGPPPPPPPSSSSSSQQRPTDPRFRSSHLSASAVVYNSHDAQVSSTLSSSLANTSAPTRNSNVNDHYNTSAAASRPNESHGSSNSYRGIGLSQPRHAPLPPHSSIIEGSGSSSSINNHNNSFSALAEPDMTALRRGSGHSMGASSGLDGSDHSGSTIGTYTSIGLQRGNLRRGSSEVLEVPIITSIDSSGYHRPSIRDNGPFRSNSFRGTSVGEGGPYSRSASTDGGPSNVRGGLGGPSLSTDSTESSFRGSDYYGPKGFSNINTEYQPPRHSPSQRGGGGGRPGFRIGISGVHSHPIGRESSLPPPPPSHPQQQQQQQRRSDPRFAAMATKTDPIYISDSLQQQNSIDHQRPQPNDVPSQDGTSRASFSASFERGRHNHDGTAPFRRSSGMATQHQPVNRMASEGVDDPFGRTNQWKSSSRPSPLSTPEDRKPSHNYFPSSPGSYEMQPPPPPPPPLSSSAATSRETSIVNSKFSIGIHGQVVPSSSSKEPPAEKYIETHLLAAPALLTSALGDENTNRAEKAVAEVELVLQLATANTGYLRELPSKQQILQSLKKLDSQIKAAQKDIASAKQEVEEAKVEEEEIRQKAATDAITEAQREIERKLEEEKERKLDEEQAHGAEINSYVEEQTLLYEAEQATHLVELEAKLKSVKDDEEKKMREALNEQMITTADNFDRDIFQMKKELEKATNVAKKHETKLSTVEKDYREKLVQSGADESVDLQTKAVDVVSQILAENQRRAAEAHLLQPMFVSQDEESTSDHSYDDLALVTDPLHGKTTAEWSQMARRVTGPADALYSEPCKAPYYAHNENMFELIAPLVQEHVRHKQNKLKKRWIELAEEYEYRQNEYKKELRKTENLDKPKKAHAVPVRHSILQGGKPNQPIVDAGGRTSSNPYRRARRGNEVRSEYEQEQIIAEIAAKEAMEKRITFGGSDLPRQICQLERELTCPYFNTFTTQRVDLLEQERTLALCNVWTDMEKSIFLDRWLQFPKDFKKIASFLRNKTTKDCIQFYYDSKQSVPYKGALREHVMRRKRRGDYNVWTLTIEAALSVGAVVEAGKSEEKPLLFLLPERDDTYNTRLFHPMKREVYDAMIFDEQATTNFYDDDIDEISKADKSRKRPREPLFTLDREQSKFLKEVIPAQSMKSINPSLSNVETSDGNLTDDGTKDGSQAPMRMAPQKWTNHEKRMFLETLEKHGKNWAMLSEAVGTKSISQIKNYHYDYKKKAGKGRADQYDKASSREEETVTPPPEPSERSELVEQTPMTGSDAETLYHETTPTESLLSRLPASHYHSLPVQQHLNQYQSHPIQLHGQQQQHSQYHSTGSSNSMPQSMAHLLHSSDNDRSMPHSEASTPDRLDIWAHAHRLQTEEAARHLLLQQHSQQTQQQQILSNLLPWINSGQLSHVAASNLQDQQLQNFLQLQQQQQQQQPHFNHLAALGLTGLSGLTSAGITGLGQSQQQQQHHHHQSHHGHHHHQQQHGGHHQSHHHHRQNSHDAQMVLAQHLLSMQAQQQQGSGSGTATMDALGLLARALPDANRNNNSTNNQGSGNYQG